MSPGLALAALLAWAAGFGLYRLCAKTDFAGGASIPALLAAAALYLAVSFGKGEKT